MFKKFLLLSLTGFSLLHAGIEVEIIKNGDKSKKYSYTNAQLVNPVNTKYSHSVIIADNVGGKIKFLNIPFGINLTFKQNKVIKSKFEIDLKYILDDVNYKKDEYLIINKYQKLPKVKFMDEKTKSFELNLLNNKDNTKIELGDYIVNIKGNVL
jgi:hypothetical protein